MRRLLILLFAPVLSLAFFVLGNPAAHAFGSEVLGCQFGTTGSTWTANSCGPGLGVVTFSPHNLSGTYSFGGTIKHDGVPVTTACSSTSSGPCLSSGCTATSSTCAVKVVPSSSAYRYVTATLGLTQSGRSRTIQATATVAYTCINFCAL